MHIHRASVHQAAKLVAALLRVAGVTAGLAESNGSRPPGLWLTSPAADCQEPGSARFGTLRSAIVYALRLPIFYGCRMQTGRESGSAKQVASLVVRTSADSESKPAVVRVIAVVVALATLTIVVVVAPLFCVRTYRPIKASSQRTV